MASIILPSRWTSQPQYPVEIDRANHFGSRVAFAIYPEILKARHLLGLETTGTVGIEPGVFLPQANESYLEQAWGSQVTSQEVTLFGQFASRTANTTGIAVSISLGGSDGIGLGVYPDFVGDEFVAQYSLSNRYVGSGDVAKTRNKPRFAVLVASNGDQKLYSDGVQVLSRSDAIATFTSSFRVRVFRHIGQNYLASYTNANQFPTALTGIINGRLTEGEVRELTANPWQIFRPQRRILYFDVASGGGPATHNLEAAAAAQASATGALSVSVPLAGAGIAVATASGAMSVSISLAGAAQAQAGASGALDVTGDASLAGNATATASASGGLSLSIPLAGGAVAQAMAAAGLSQSVALGGDATAAASATGALTLNVSLAGAAIAQAAADAGLTVTNASSLAADAQASASASGALSVGVPLSGAALTVASADGSLTHIVPLAGSAASASLATGGLDVAVSLSAAALAQAMAAAGLTVEQGGLAGAAAAQASASGTITLRVNLTADAVAQAVAAGALDGDGTLVATAGWAIARTPRNWKIARQARTWRIAA